MTRTHLSYGLLALLGLVGCSSRAAPDCTALDDVSHEAYSIALPARQALLGRVEGFDALQLQRARGEVLVRRLTQSSESDSSSWWGSSSDEAEPYADLREQWLTLRGHMDELLQARPEILAMRGAMDAQTRLMPQLIGGIDELARLGMDEHVIDVTQLYTLMRMWHIAGRIGLPRDELFTAEYIGVDGGFFRCSIKTYVLTQVFEGFRDGNEEMGLSAIDSGHARQLLDELLEIVQQVAAQYETICASEMMIGKAQESFSALKQAATELQAMADSAALRCGD